MSDSSYTGSVRAHYTDEQMGTMIVTALKKAGKNLDALTPDDLAPFDQLHIRGKAATLELAELAGIKAGASVLDVGGGLGGPARVLASHFGCNVTVLDLNEEFCKVGTMLTEMTHLDDHVTYRLGNALQMPFADRSFDFVWTQHSSMNIAEKEQLYQEAYRVLRPCGRLAMHEVMAGPVSPIHYPVPWSQDESISFLRSPEAIHDLLTGIGFKEIVWIDTSAADIEWFKEQQQKQGETGRPQFSTAMLLARGNEFTTGIANVRRNLVENRLKIIKCVFERP